MGREKAFAILLLILFLPGWFAGEINLKKSYRDMKYVAGETGWVVDKSLGLFDWIAEFSNNIENGERIQDYLFVNSYSSGGQRASYFRGIETETGEPEYLTEGAWEEINAAKKAFALAAEECGFASPSCTKRLYEIMGHVQKGNKNAAGAAKSAFSIMDSNFEKLGWMGGNNIQYGGYPLSVYREVSNAYEPGGRLENYKKAIAGYYSIDVGGRASVRIDWKKLPLFLSAIYSPHSITLTLLEDPTSLPIEVKAKLPGQYQHSYNLLVGASNDNSAVKELLRLNKKIKKAIGYMENSYVEKGKRADSLIGELSKKVDDADGERIGDIQYGRLSKAVVLQQDYRQLIASAKKSLRAAKGENYAASGIYSAGMEGFVANATMTKRAVIEEAEAGIETMDSAVAIVLGARNEIRKRCAMLSREAEDAAIKNGLFSLEQLKKASEKCDDAGGGGYAGQINGCLDAMDELSFLKSNDMGAAEMARREVERLDAMAAAAASDIPVSAEKLQLKEAKRYLGSCAYSAKACASSLKKAYQLAIAGQKSLMDRAKVAYGSLAGEREDALRLMGKVAQLADRGSVPEYYPLKKKLDVMETYYSGSITANSLGHLSKARELYSSIYRLKGYIDPAKLLEIEDSETIVGDIQCNEEVMVSHNKTIRNRYGFEVGGIEPHGERHELTSGYERALVCGELKSKVLWFTRSYNEIRASREIRLMRSVDKALVGFPVGGVVSVSSLNYNLTPDGFELIVPYPKNGTVGATFRTPPTMGIYGPTCERDGEYENCSYVLALPCDEIQDANVLFSYPLSAGDKVMVDNGNARNLGQLGVLVEKVGCPGYVSLDIAHQNLSEEAAAMLSKISYELNGLEGTEKEGYLKRYDALKLRSPREIISGGGRLLGEIAEAKKEQLKRQLDESRRKMIGEKIGALKKWFGDRGIELPMLPSIEEDALPMLENAKKEEMGTLAARYQKTVASASELSEVGNLLEKFGLGTRKLAELNSKMRLIKDDDEYLSFSKQEHEISGLIHQVGEEEKGLAQGASLSNIPKEFPAKEELEKAADTGVGFGNPEFIISESYPSDVASRYKGLFTVQEESKDIYDGTAESLKRIVQEEELPDTIEGGADSLVKEAKEKVEGAAKAAEREVAAAEKTGDAYYAKLARESLEAGYLNRAYAYAKKAEGEKERDSGLLTLGNSGFLLVPVLLAGAVWYFRKKRKIETQVQRAIRISS